MARPIPRFFETDKKTSLAEIKRRTQPRRDTFRQKFVVGGTTITLAGTVLLIVGGINNAPSGPVGLGLLCGGAFWLYLAWLLED